MKPYTKLLIVFARLAGMWLVACGCRYLMLSNKAMAIQDFLVATLVVCIEVRLIDELMKEIQQQK